MASPIKQQKRAKRSATKAKQNRVARSGKAIAATNTKDPDFELTIDEVFEQAAEAGAYDKLFADMNEALQGEAGLVGLCAVFLQDSLLQLVVESFDEEQATDYIMAVLVSYRIAEGDPDEETAISWVESEAFQIAYVAASEALAKT
ncbi:hypothetical protein [Pseudomonas sp. R5(2019)]|uniref:hypothetical protein n=1 Tax=Pseudomonas sp. R5(2019) TaxID=2697566 RepID=UPI001412C383|nr:hypothetical protein [Pseudomonas sp. R5(2019)]NBA98390.1 hypothetical protein [Pseudomonas sp. R5(2019)]